MRITYPAGSRNFPGDRNAITRVNTYNALSIAPHADVQRWSYTVPAAKKFQISGGQIMSYQSTVVGVAGRNQAYLRITPSGGAATIFLHRSRILGTAGETADDICPAGGMLSTGDNIEARTADLATGGSVDYNLNITGFEYDA